ncbi:hypothetical protein TNCV_233211 [Trichonephila clavipes]|nr:hypothetical protein TNCV_233211 [Trichonephila clavipes]
MLIYDTPCIGIDQKIKENPQVNKRAIYSLNYIVLDPLGGLEVACPLRKSKVACTIKVGIDKFSGYENSRHACHMIMGHVKDFLNNNLALVLTAIFNRIRRDLELKLIQASKFGSYDRHYMVPP